MPVLAALLALALVAAPPLTPTADNDAIHAEIAASDPRLTNPPAPLERLLAAVALAEQRLRQAADPDAVLDALTLTVAGHRVAYQRTGEVRHLCRVIAAADQVLAQDRVSPGLEAATTDFRQEARNLLGDRTCEARPPEQTATPTASEASPPEQTADPTATTTAPAHRVTPPVDRADRRRVRAGIGTLVPGLVLFAPVAGLLAYRAATRDDLASLNADTQSRPATDTEVRRANALNNRYAATTAGVVALGVTGAALVVTGAVLLATGVRPGRVAVAPWGGRAIGGLVVQGRF